jgi:hypothetical protein
LKMLKPDLWVAAHVSQCGLLAKHASGNYEDPFGYAAAVTACEADFETKVRQSLVLDATLSSHPACSPARCPGGGAACVSRASRLLSSRSPSCAYLHWSLLFWERVVEGRGRLPEVDPQEARALTEGAWTREVHPLAAMRTEGTIRRCMPSPLTSTARERSRARAKIAPANASGR